MLIQSLLEVQSLTLSQRKGSHLMCTETKSRLPFRGQQRRAAPSAQYQPCWAVGDHTNLVWPTRS